MPRIESAVVKSQADRLGISENQLTDILSACLRVMGDMRRYPSLQEGVPGRPPSLLPPDQWFSVNDSPKRFKKYVERSGPALKGGEVDLIRVLEEILAGPNRHPGFIINVNPSRHQTRRSPATPSGLARNADAPICITEQEPAQDVPSRFRRTLLERARKFTKNITTQWRQRNDASPCDCTAKS